MSRFLQSMKKKKAHRVLRHTFQTNKFHCNNEILFQPPNQPNGVKAGVTIHSTCHNPRKQTSCYHENNNKEFAKAHQPCKKAIFIRYIRNECTLSSSNRSLMCSGLCCRASPRRNIRGPFNILLTSTQSSGIRTDSMES